MALTRHRYSTTLFFDREHFKDFKSLQSSMGRLFNKDLVLDYSISPEDQDAWSTVQEYRLLGQDLISTIQDKDWISYQAIKKSRMESAKTILEKWEEHEDFSRQSGFGRESIAITAGLKVRPLSSIEISAQERVLCYQEKAFEARELWRSIRKTHPGSHCVQHTLYSSFDEIRKQRNTIAKAIFSEKILHKDFVQVLAKTQGIGWKTIESQAKLHHDFENNDLETTENFNSKRFSFDMGYIKNELQQNISELAILILGEPQRRSVREWRYGEKGSVCVHVAGTKKGLYADFENGFFGGPLTLIQAQLKIDHKAAFKWALDWLGHSNEFKIKETSLIQTRQFETNKWVPIYPVPNAFLNPCLKAEKQLQYQLEDKHEVSRFTYRNSEGKILAYTIRLEDGRGNKIVLPLSYCQHTSGLSQWRWQGFGKERPLYGLECLSSNPEKKVLLVKGEKTAEAAKILFPDRVVVSWQGGVGAVNHVDWSPLISKKISLWPDHDESGRKAIDKIEEHLILLHKKNSLEPHIQKVILPLETPKKWDLADPLPNGWTTEKLTNILEEKSNLTTHLIHETLKKYSIEQQTEQTTHFSYEFFEKVHLLYQEMCNWHHLLEIKPSVDLSQKLLEKAILANVLLPQTKYGFYFENTRLEEKMRSEDIALASAGLIQKHYDEEHTIKNSIKHFLKNGSRIVYDLDKNMHSLLEANKALYPKNSDQQLKILIHQEFLCKNSIGFDFNEISKQKVLNTAQQFESLTQEGIVSNLVKKVVSEQVHSSEKEDKQSVALALEREFMKLTVSEKFSDHQLNTSECRIILERTVQNTQQLQILLEQRQKSLSQERLKQQSLSKEGDREL